MVSLVMAHLQRMHHASNPTIKNINIESTNTLEADYDGALCQQYFGKNIVNGTILI